MKRNLSFVLALILLACCSAVFFSCGGGSEDQDPTTTAATLPATEPETEPETVARTSAAETTTVAVTTEAPEEEEPKIVQYPVADAPFDPADGMTENMLARSIYYEGDVSRLKAKLAQIYDESYTGQTRFFFLGDSITAGSGSSGGQNAFWRLTEAWLNENAKSEIYCKNCGIGATDTYLAVHRVDRDVLSKDPDVIFIEFINDSDDEFYTACMESLIRKCLAAPTNPAVVLIEMTLKGGGNCQNAHATAAKAYGVPVLSYHDAVTPEVEAGNFAFNAISGDGTHPNIIGHSWVARIITHFLEEVSADPTEGTVTAFDPATPSITGDKYANAGIYDRNSGEVTAHPDNNFILRTTPSKFNNGWGTDSNGTITFEAVFKNFGLLYYKTTDGKTGFITVEIDGVKYGGVISGDFSGGWGDYPASVEIYTSARARTHTVTVTVRPGTKSHFEILALLMS